MWKELFKRLEEPSSYAAIAVAVAVFFPGFEEWMGWNHITEVLVGLSATVGLMMKEKK